MSRKGDALTGKTSSSRNKAAARKTRQDQALLVLQFSEARCLRDVLGPHDCYLARVEQLCGVTIQCRGTRLQISGADGLMRQVAERSLKDLYEKVENGAAIQAPDVDAAIHFAEVSVNRSGEEAPDADSGQVQIATPKRVVTPRNTRQADYMKAIRDHELVFGLGPAGTGKTYIAVAMGVSMLLSGQVDRMILSRPAVEAGENLGFLPGDLREKVDPYLRPLYDALYDMLPGDHVVRRMEQGDIEVAPLAFMRGRTLANAFVILDEAQNTTAVQMKMFLTRIGENSRMIVIGDPSQVDLPQHAKSGLRDAVSILQNLPEVMTVHFGERDVVRHRLVTQVVRAYNAKEAKEAKERKDRNPDGA